MIDSSQIDKRQVLVNAGMAVVQVMVVGATLFFVYGFLIRTLGAVRFGIWSLVLAWSSISQLADLGLGASAVKFVAKYTARNDHAIVSAVLETSLVTVGGLMALLLLSLYPVSYYGLKLLVHESALVDARHILPFAFFSMWLMCISGVLTSGLAGFQRIDLRAWAVIAGTLLYAGLCVILVRPYGLVGVAYASVGQNIALTIISTALLRRFARVSLFPPRWNKPLFREMLSYSVNFQVVALTTVLLDPLTKALVSIYGGLASVAYYEMASKLVSQVRSLVVSANQVLVPAVAQLAEKAPNLVGRVYVESYRVAFVVALFGYALLAILMPLVSTVWIGHYDSTFVVYGIIVAVTYFVNTLVAPAYFVYLGQGRLRWVVLGHLTIAACNLVFGVLLGMSFGKIGVIVGWSCALMTGSALITAAYHVESGCSWGVLLPRESLRFAVWTAVVLLGAFGVWSVGAPGSHGALKGTAVTMTFAILTYATLRKHPLRFRVEGWLRTYLWKRERVTA